MELWVQGQKEMINFLTMMTLFKYFSKSDNDSKKIGTLYKTAPRDPFLLVFILCVIPGEPWPSDLLPTKKIQKTGWDVAFKSTLHCTPETIHYMANK